MAFLEVKHLSKKYAGNDFYSLKDASFTIDQGEIVGLVGKNGSGKSTLLKCIAKSQFPTQGEILFQDQNLYAEEDMLEDFGIMIDPVFFPQISVLENLQLFLKIHQKEHYSNNIKSILELVGLWDARYRKPKDFSFGMKQRTALALALITEPSFILLDEPFVGLDPIGVQHLLQILKNWAQTKKTAMLVSSHQLSELEELCQRFLFIDRGQISEATPAEQKTILIELALPIQETELAQQLANLGARSSSDQIVEIPTDILLSERNQIFQLLAQAKLIKGVLSKRDHLETLFVED
ncbi:ABC transporter ATP-binding protein [Streptococcus danieliae]|uniref:ABC transporter ATP-binding protein n=1 Tax=Streptococcus danieliae TaxID=747656 RepID=UPI0021C9AE5B|nr:ABC transporter ATP-binding protein [Streptococcus danieliae]MCU0082692.1 ABC transporter ATP-binding protein [Streptococcus danieliae]